MTSTDGYWITAAVLSGNENKSMQRSRVPTEAPKHSPPLSRQPRYRRAAYDCRTLSAVTKYGRSHEGHGHGINMQPMPERCAGSLLNHQTKHEGALSVSHAM